MVCSPVMLPAGQVTVTDMSKTLAIPRPHSGQPGEGSVWCGISHGHSRIGGVRAAGEAIERTRGGEPVAQSSPKEGVTGLMCPVSHGFPAVCFHYPVQFPLEYLWVMRFNKQKPSERKTTVDPVKKQHLRIPSQRLAGHSPWLNPSGHLHPLKSPLNHP